MSLKTVHLVFIIASILLASFLAVWCFRQYMVAGSSSMLGGGVGSTAVGLFLIWYGIRFLQKFRNVRFY